MLCLPAALELLSLVRATSDGPGMKKPRACTPARPPCPPQGSPQRERERERGLAMPVVLASPLFKHARCVFVLCIVGASRWSHVDSTWPAGAHCARLGTVALVAQLAGLQYGSSWSTRRSTSWICHGRRSRRTTCRCRRS